MTAGTPLIEITDLSVGFTGRSGRTLPVLRNVDLRVRRGESVGLVGESGSGKSTLALAAMGYLKHGLRHLGGSVRFDGAEMFTLSRAGLERIRGGRLALIPQNSGQSLTPSLRVGAQLAEALRLHAALPESAHAARVEELLAQVRLPDPTAIAARYPHELSGGQQQRVAIAMALAGEPEALLLDEPTTGLDVTTQAHILELLRDLAARNDLAMVYVSHDLGAIARVCDRVAVMYAGEVVLEGPVRRVLRDPGHPYARGLLGSIPRLSDPGLPLALDGRPPAPGAAGQGCAFTPRCALAEPACTAARPPLAEVQPGEWVRCRRAERVRDLPMAAPHQGRDRPQLAADPALMLDGLAISYARRSFIHQILGRPAKGPNTVDGISITLRKGETLGLVGESGSGKSTILKAIAGLLGPAAGSISLGADEILPPLIDGRSPAQLRRTQLVFQNPDESLNPRQTIAEIIAQPLMLYFGLTGEALAVRSAALLEQVRLGPHYLDRMPGQLSGGEKQRIAIARAFAADPELVLCDEVTSALDVSVQAAVLRLLDDLRRAHGSTYVFVSHDLAVVRALSDRVAVLYQGRLCEIGPAAALYATPGHPYTRVLLGAVLEPDPDKAPELQADDTVELSPPACGCPFQRRCPVKVGPVCDRDTPPMRTLGPGHNYRCHAVA